MIGILEEFSGGGAAGVYGEERERKEKKKLGCRGNERSPSL